MFFPKVICRKWRIRVSFAQSASASVNASLWKLNDERTKLMREPAALRSEEQIRGQLEILQAIATFLSAETPSLVTSSFIIYYRDFGHEDCVEAILETVHLRSDMTPSKLAAWGEAVAIWRKSINRAQGSIKRKNRFDLPHLQERKNEGLVFTTFAAKKELHGSDSKNIDNQTVLPAAVEKKRLKVISLT